MEINQNTFHKLNSFNTIYVCLEFIPSIYFHYLFALIHLIHIQLLLQRDLRKTVRTLFAAVFIYFALLFKSDLQNEN